MVLTTHPLLALRTRECTAIPLPTLWAVESVTGYLYLFNFLKTNDFEEGPLICR
jgi:hypothetical protein